VVSPPATYDFAAVILSATSDSGAIGSGAFNT